MVRKTLSLLAAPMLVSAQVLNNFTISFFPTDKEDQCNDNSIKSAITLTTESVPRAYTCFNVSTLFSSDEVVGFQNDTYGSNLHDPSGTDPSLQPPKGIHYLLKNLDAYDEKANYTNVWYKNINDTKAEDGEASRWVVHTYAFDDCEQVGGDDFERDDYPWFDSSCQTSEDGQCEVLDQPIKSFAIGPAASFDGGRGCMAWAEMGAGAKLIPSGSAIAAVAAGVAAYMLAM